MDEHSLYEADFYGWTREQVEVLRGMRGQAGLPNGLDLDNVIEEIESVGSEARRAVESHARLILVHLIKIATSANEAQHRHWRAEAQSFHSEIEGRYTRAMRQDINLDRLWRRAVKDARASLAIYEEELPMDVSDTCPLTLDAFTEEEFDIDVALRSIAAAFEGRNRT